MQRADGARYWATLEELKRQYGHAVVTAVPQDAQIEIANPQPEMLSLRRVAEILEPRARELFYFVRESLRQGGVLDALGAGCVLTGGGAMLPGMLDQAESQLRVPARTGMPVRIEIPLDLPSLKTTVVMSNLVFDEKIDEAMFDVQPPPGYMLMKLDLPILASAPSEDDIVELLRWYTDKSTGNFPKALDSWIDFIKVAKHPSQRPDQKELMGVMMHVGRATAFLGSLGAGKYG